MDGAEESGRGIEEIWRQSELVWDRMNRVRHKIAVVSGKGEVGKTLVTVNLAASLAGEGLSVGLLDSDITGP